MFTRRLKQLVGNAAADIGSQPVPTEVSPAKPVGKKHAGKAISEVVAVPVPFGSLPGDFGMQPLVAEEASYKKLVDKASNVTGGEEKVTPTKATGAEVVAAKATVTGTVTGGEVSAAKGTGAEVEEVAAKATAAVPAKATRGVVGGKTTSAEVAAAATLPAKVTRSIAASKKRVAVDEDATRKKPKNAVKKLEVEGVSEAKGKGVKKKTVVEVALDEADMKKPAINVKKKLKGRGKKPTVAKVAEDIVAVVDEDAEKRKDVLLRYPFIFGREIETATKSFQRCHFYNSWLDDAFDKMSDDEVIKLQQEASNVRKKKVEITQYDVKSLMPGTFVNDNIVDFWMCWITRKEIATESSVHIFTAHFYVTLRDKGYDAVATWTVNKGINIFKKKMILIPVNQDKHWSLCAIINAGYIDYGGVQLYADAFQVPVLVHLDSLNLHSMAEISNNIKTWLNAEYSREKNRPDSTIFNNITIRNVVLQGKVIFIWILFLL